MIQLPTTKLLISSKIIITAASVLQSRSNSGVKDQFHAHDSCVIAEEYFENYTVGKLRKRVELLETIELWFSGMTTAT